MSTARLYRRYADVIGRFARETHRSESRDLTVKLQQELKLAFESRPIDRIQIRDLHKCMKMLNALEQLAHDKHRREFAVPNVGVGVHGQTVDDLRQMADFEVVETGSKQSKPSVWSRMVSRIKTKNQISTADAPEDQTNMSRSTFVAFLADNDDTAKKTI